MSPVRIREAKTKVRSNTFRPFPSLPARQKAGDVPGRQTALPYPLLTGNSAARSR